jgi:hypothetical protein
MANYIKMNIISSAANVFVMDILSSAKAQLAYYREN